MLDARATRGEISHAGQNTVLRRARRSFRLTRVWTGVRPCFSSPTASCVRYTFKNILSHLESSVIMTSDHRIKGRAAWNVLDLVVNTLLHVREPGDLLHNSASVQAYHNLGTQKP